MFPSLKSCMLHFWQAQADDWHEKETELAGDRPVLLRVTLILHYIMMWRAWARLCVNITGRKHCFQNPHPCFAWMEGSARTGGGSEWMNNPETRAKKHEGLTDWLRGMPAKKSTQRKELWAAREVLSRSLRLRRQVDQALHHSKTVNCGTTLYWLASHLLWLTLLFTCIAAGLYFHFPLHFSHHWLHGGKDRKPACSGEENSSASVSCVKVWF